MAQWVWLTYFKGLETSPKLDPVLHVLEPLHLLVSNNVIHPVKVSLHNYCIQLLITFVLLNVLLILNSLLIVSRVYTLDCVYTHFSAFSKRSF